MGFWTSIFGVDAEQSKLAQQATEDAKRVAFDNYTSGKWTLAQYQSTMARLEGNTQDLATADKQIKDAFVEGANDGLKNVQNTIQKATSWTLSGAFGLIPWQIKLGVAIVGGIWLFQWWKTITPRNG